MKRPSILSFLLSMALFAPVAGAGEGLAEGPCGGPEYHQFDFWLGEWSVTSGGAPAGTNNVRSILDGCAIQENWQGVGDGGIRGTSYNVFDRATGLWHQTWVDSGGTLLQLDGGLSGDAMVLRGERPSREGGGTVLHRIQWTPGEDGSVRQLWEASQDGGRTWSVLFDGLYVRAGEP